MRKLDRLRQIEKAYGPDFVLPYRACYDWLDIGDAIDAFWKSGHTPSLRTDWRNAPEQGYGLPFVHPGVKLPQAREVWERWGDRLVYIVTEGVGPGNTLCNVTAIRMGPTLFLAEWDEGGCAQRAWEQTCVPLHHAFVDGYGSWWQPVPPWPNGVRVVRPKAVPDCTRIERMYPRILAAGDEHTIWTVRKDDDRIVVW